MAVYSCYTSKLRTRKLYLRKKSSAVSNWRYFSLDIFQELRSSLIFYSRQNMWQQSHIFTPSPDTKVLCCDYSYIQYMIFLRTRCQFSLDSFVKSRQTEFRRFWTWVFGNLYFSNLCFYSLYLTFTKIRLSFAKTWQKNVQNFPKTWVLSSCLLACTFVVALFFIKSICLMSHRT